MSAGGPGPAPPAGVPTGNTFDKYGSASPVVRRLMASFQRSLWELLAIADPASVLDVGCGEGVLTERIAARLAPREVLGVDLADANLAAHWATRTGPRFAVMDAGRLALPDGAFACVVATEVLEHLPEPEAALAEMARVSGGRLIVSVPREPVWRALNLARGAYLPALGNTPGHLQHWSGRSFDRLLGRHGRILAARAPGPWLMRLVAVR